MKQPRKIKSTNKKIKKNNKSKVLALAHASYDPNDYDKLAVLLAEV